MKKPVVTFKRALITAALLLTGSVLPVAADPYATAVLLDNPVAFWQLNEASGTTALDSAGSHNGIYTNALVGQTGYTNGSDPTALAASFGSPAGQSQDSLVGGLLVDFASNVNTAFSVEAWVKGPPQSAGAGIVGKGTGSAEQFYLDCGGTANGFRFFVRNNAGTAFTASSSFTGDNNWHYLVGVCDELHSNLFLYIDGNLSVSNAASAGIRVSSNASMNIGSRQAAAGSYTDQFSGSIGDVAVYKGALTLTQIRNHYFAAGIAPTISVQPTNSVTTNEGSAVILAAGGFGSPPLIYQWETNGIPVAGQTNATFSNSSISASFSGSLLTLVVSNAYGTAATTGTYLTVYSGAPQIVGDVVPAQLTLYTGQTNIYSVTAQNTIPFYYQWYSNGVPVTGATNSTFTVTASVATNTYSATVSNNYGGGSITPSSTSTLVGIALPSGPYATKILADHPIAYWRLDDATNSTTAAEYVGGHTGTYNNNNVQLGVPGYSPLYDPDTAAAFGSLALTDSYMAEDQVASGNVPLLDFAAPNGSNAEFSVEAWVNGPAGQNATSSAIVAKGNNGSEEFLLDASGAGGSFRFYTRKVLNGTSIINGATVPDGNWHHLVGVCDEAGGVISLYVDGVISAQVTGQTATGIFSSTTPISIGAQNVSGDYTGQFIGTIDEVSVYNYALTAAQVQAHYNAAPVPPYFTVQPPTNIVALVAQHITLSAQVLGSPTIGFQWYSNSIPIPGQTSISLAVNTLQPGTNTYTLVASNGFGTITNLGTVVQIPVGTGPPAIAIDIAPTNTARYATLPLTFSITASGAAPLSYQWWFNSAPIPGATANSYGIASLAASNAGPYYCVVSNSISTTPSSTSTLTVVPAPTNVYPLTIIQDRPVAYWRLDETVGTSNGFDYVGGNNGQYYALLATNIPKLGVPGYSTNFDPDTACLFGQGGTGASNNYLGNIITNIDFAVPNGESGAFSLEAWIHGTAGANQIGGGCVVAKGQGGNENFSMDVNSGFRFYTRNAAGGIVANAQASPNLGGSIVSGNWQMDGKWHYVVGVCDQANSNLLLYVDGQLIGPNVITNGVVPPFVFYYDTNHAPSVTTTGTNGIITPGAGIYESGPASTNSNENSVTIGNRNKSTAHTGNTAYDLPFVGTLDEIALYNYALTPTQVANHYAVATGASLPLTIQSSGSNYVVTWSSAATLQTSTNIPGGWSTVTNATSPYTNAVSGSRQFYRLKIH